MFSSNKIKRRRYIYLFIFIIGIMMSYGCSKKMEGKVQNSGTPQASMQPTNSPICTPTYYVAPSSSITITPTVMPSSSPTPTEIVKRIVCIDPGHQKKGDSNKEPLGPGSDELKAKVTGGTIGVETKIYEYQLALTVSLLLKTELESRGYEVVMTRTTHDVNISNSERAEIANSANADVFIRIHANAADNTTARGVMTICQTANNPFNSYIYKDSKALSQCILDCIIAATDANKKGIWETDSMSGINWSKVPVTIVEMGYMSNPEEDKLLNDANYQKKMVKGIADGIDLYFIDKMLDF